MKNIKQIMISMIKRISSTTITQRYFVSSVVFLFGVGFLILAQIRGGENTKKFQSQSDEKTTSNSKTEGTSQSEPASTVIDKDTTVENVVTTSALIISVSAEVVNRCGTTGNPLYHDGLPSANEVTSLTFNSQEGNVTTFDYYFKDILSIPSYGRQAEGIQSGQLIVTVYNNGTATIRITGGVPQVTNVGSEVVDIQSYSVGETRIIGVAAGQQIQGLLVQQSFGQSPLGSVDNLSGDYLLTFNK